MMRSSRTMSKRIWVFSPTGTRRLPGTHANSNAMASVLYASTLYEAGELEQAAHLLNIYVPLIRDIALPDQMILGHVLLSRLHFHRGDVDQALQLLTELEYLGHRKTLPRVVASARLERARMLMLQGNASAAGMELDRAGTPGLWERVGRMRLLAHDTDYLALARLRRAVANGEAERALATFLAKSQARGHRCVLVITGKGGERRGADFERTGVLRRMVPLWLNAPANRARVLAFDEARAQHGGGGALYVLLKRARSE